MQKYRAFKDSWSVNSFKKRYEKGEINFDNYIQISSFAKWIIYFYKNMPTEYLEASNKQTTSLKNINRRLDIIKRSVEGYINN